MKKFFLWICLFFLSVSLFADYDANLIVRPGSIRTRSGFYVLLDGVVILSSSAWSPKEGEFWLTAGNHVLTIISTNTDGREREVERRTIQLTAERRSEGPNTFTLLFDVNSSRNIANLQFIRPPAPPQRPTPPAPENSTNPSVQNTINNYGNAQQSGTPARYPEGVSVDIDGIRYIIFRNYNDHIVTVSFVVTYQDGTQTGTLQKVLQGKPTNGSYFQERWEGSRSIMSVAPGY